MVQKTLQMLSSMATRDLLRGLAAQYAQASSLIVDAQAAGGVDVAKRVSAGEAVDVVVLASNAIDKLIAEGKVLAGSRVDLVRSGIAVAVREGARLPDISSEQGVRDAVVGAATLSYSTGPSGVYLEKLFERWGILGQIRERIVVPPPGIPVGSLVADGRVELGFQQLSELIALPGISVVGPLPAVIQSMTIFSGGVAAASADPVAARAFLQFMAGPGTAAIKIRGGMESA